MFNIVRKRNEFVSKGRRFCYDFPTEAIPVFTGERDDLVSTVANATRYYVSVESPAKADLGINIADEETSECFTHFLPFFAEEWIRATDVCFNCIGRTYQSVIVFGLYRDLTWKNIKDLLFFCYRTKKQLYFISGRDIHSLSWMVAKQFSRWTDKIKSIGVFTSGSLDVCRIDNLYSFDYNKLKSVNIQAELLRKKWKSILLQGHGKDDSVNLRDFTICGRNPVVQPAENSLAPRCGHSAQHCYKDESKLIPVQEIITENMVLSGCNSAPIAGLGLYDPKYLLLLAAIDGYAKHITAALSIHSSNYPENDNWVRLIATGEICGADLLNESLRACHPFPAFWQFGGRLPNWPDISGLPREPDSRLLAIIDRSHSYEVSAFLTDKHPTRRSLKKFNKKMNATLKRKNRYIDGLTEQRISREIYHHTENMDKLIASHIREDPENGMILYESYYADRSLLDYESVCETPCSCGHSAVRYERKGIVNAILDTVAVICLRCGDKQSYLKGGPVVFVDSPDSIASGQSLDFQVSAIPAQSGKLFFGCFVPPYIRQFVVENPNIISKKCNRGDKISFEMSLRFSESIPAQAYYFTVFAVQDLAIGSCREHFGFKKI